MEFVFNIFFYQQYETADGNKEGIENMYHEYEKWHTSTYDYQPVSFDVFYEYVDSNYEIENNIVSNIKKYVNDPNNLAQTN